MSSASYIACLTYVLLMHKALCLQYENCIELKFYHMNKDELSVLQNNFINVTFWMDVSKCKDTSSSYRMRVRTRAKTGSPEYDGTITYWRHTCTDRAHRSVRCISPTGPAELYKTVNHSHVQVEWELMTQYGEFTLMRKKINFLYPPYVTNLTEDKREVREITYRSYKRYKMQTVSEKAKTSKTFWNRDINDIITTRRLDLPERGEWHVITWSLSDKRMFRSLWHRSQAL